MPTSGPALYRCWFRISLRALMVLVLIVGGLIGWMAHTIRTQRQAVAAVRAADALVFYDWQIGDIAPQSAAAPVYRTEPTAPRWLRRILGDELFQSVNNVQFRQPIDPALLATVARFDRLAYLDFTDAGGPAESYAGLATLTHLEHLGVHGPGVTDAKLAAVGQIRSLQTLVVDRVEATDAGYAALAGLGNMTGLYIARPGPLTDAGLSQALAGMPRLESLQLDGYRRPLATTLGGLPRWQPNLELLRIQYVPVTDADLAAIGRLTRLRELVIQQAPVTDAGLGYLRKLDRLTLLALSACPNITDAGLVPLGRLPALKVLAVESAWISDAGLVHLTSLPRLSQLTLNDTAVTDAGLATLARISTLSFLTLDDNPGITDAGQVPAHFGPSLGWLQLYGTAVTPAGVNTLIAARPGLTIRAPAVAPPPVPAAVGP